MMVRTMAEADARAIAGWHYEGAYSFYDMEQDPDDLGELLDPANWGSSYFAVDDECGELVGFFCFALSEPAVVEIGLGLRPDLTGRGLGPSFLETGLAFASAQYRPLGFRLAVAAFNTRAIRLYEGAGFRWVRTFVQETNGGQHEFVEMSKPA